MRPLEARSIASSERSCAASSASLGADDRYADRAARDAARPRPPSPAAGCAGLEPERGLAAAHREVHVREDARIEQRPVQVAAGVVDAVALAERVEAVALARVHAPRERERVADAAVIGDAASRVPAAASSAFEEADVELRVVDHELGAVHEGQELLRDLGERRLRREELVGDAVDREGARLDLAVRAAGSDASAGRSGAGAGARRSRSR